MQKLVLLSILLATVFIPIAAARMRSARGSLRKTLVAVALLNVFYLLALLFVYPHLH